MGKKLRIVACIAAMAAIAIAFIAVFNHKKAVNPERITLAVAAQPISVPVYVAYEKGFFKDEDLQVSLPSFSAGKDALALVLQGKADFCTVADTPIVFAAMKGKSFYIIATMAETTKYLKIVGRQDRGIRSAMDLAGKRIGVTLGTNAEYYLDTLLTYNKIGKTRVKIVPYKVEDMADALMKGDIDAALAWRPFISRLQKLLGNNAVTLEDDSIYKMNWIIAGDQAFISSHPETVKKLLRALRRAERYIMENPTESAQIIARVVGAEDNALDNYNFYLRLDQSLLVLLEDEARWAIDQRLTDKSSIPNFLNVTYSKGMQAIDGQAVTLIHK